MRAVRTILSYTLAFTLLPIVGASLPSKLPWLFTPTMSYTYMALAVVFALQLDHKAIYAVRMARYRRAYRRWELAYGVSA